MSAPLPPEERTLEQRKSKAPSPGQAWTMVLVIVVGFIVGGLGLIYNYSGYLWLLYLGTGIVAVGFLYGWWINIFEFTEEETRIYESGQTERIEPATDPRHG